MSRRRSSLWAIVAAVCVVIFVWSTTRTIAVPLPPFPIDPFWLAWVGLPVVGAFILVKRPGNAVGAVTLGIAAALIQAVLSYRRGSPLERLQRLEL